MVDNEALKLVKKQVKFNVFLLYIYIYDIFRILPWKITFYIHFSTNNLPFSYKNIVLNV